MLGVDPALLNALVQDVNSLSNTKLRDIILFGVKCSRNPQSLSDADYEKLHHHGLGQPEILELIAMSGLVCMRILWLMRPAWMPTPYLVLFNVVKSNYRHSPSSSLNEYFPAADPNLVGH